MVLIQSTWLLSNFQLSDGLEMSQFLYKLYNTGVLKTSLALAGIVLKLEKK